MKEITLEEMRDNGLLWLINATCFHPRGYALTFTQEEDGSISGIGISGDGKEPWYFDDEAKMQQNFDAANSFLASVG